MVEQSLSSGGLVNRPELLQRLAGGRAARLTLITAPAGYGKTTLLTAWLAEGAASPSGRVVLSYPLGEADNAPAHLLAGLVAGVRAALPNPAALPPIDETQASLSYPLALLFQEAARLAGPQWRLVLDDYHRLTNPAIHQALDTLLNLPTWPVQLVLASRTLPPLAAIARLRVEGRLVELDERDLRFTLAEAAALFAASDLHLKEAELKAVAERTEGWAAALRLACQAAQRESGAGLANILDHMGDSGHLFDYLAGQVLNRQPGEVRRFLIRTALLSYLDAELCNAYLGLGEARAILDTLERDHLFLVRLPEGSRPRYRYHALFAEFLGRCLEQEEGAPAVQAWHRRAARCFLDRLTTVHSAQRLDEHLAVVHHWLAAQDWAAAAEAIETVASQLDPGQVTLMQAWFDALPREVLAARPRLLMALGLLRERQSRWGEALEALAQAERRLREAGESLETVRVLRMQGWVHFRQGRYAEARVLGYRAVAHLLRVPEPDLSAGQWPDRIEAVLEKSDWSQDALGAPLAPSQLRLLAWTYHVVNSCDGETDQAERVEKNFQRELRIYRQLGDRRLEASALHNLAVGVYKPQGRLAEALEADQRCLRIEEERDSYDICFPLYGLSETRWMLGEYASARAPLARLLELADAHQDPFWQGYALYMSGHLHRAQGNRPAARTDYEEALGLGLALQEPSILFEPRWGLAWLALEAGDWREAQRLGEGALQQVQAIGYRLCEGRALTVLGLALDQRGDVPQAEARLGEALGVFQNLSANLDLALVYLYLADLYRRDGREAEALTQLERCLALSRRYGYDFLFTVRERPRALPLLVAALAQDREAAEAAEAARLLRPMGSEAAEPLLALLADSAAQTPMQAGVFQLLGEVGDERALPTLDRLRRRRGCKAAAEAALQRIAARPAPALRVLALGNFQVWRGNVLIPPEAWQQRRKARLLLLYLLTQRRLVPRDELLEALWPDLAPESARLALNTTFSDLRKLLEPYLGKGRSSRYLVRADEGYAFNRQSETDYDVQAFELATRPGGAAARHPLELYRGDFLPEEPYADWVVRERERLRGLYLNTLTRLLDQQMQQGAWREAIDLARHILDREPWLEEVWRSLMTCYVALGRRSEALQAYQACEHSLQQELNVAPSALTRALYEQLKA